MIRLRLMYNISYTLLASYILLTLIWWVKYRKGATIKIRPVQRFDLFAQDTASRIKILRMEPSLLLI